MAANPLVPQGTLNRVRANIVIPAFPSLNVTSPYLGRAGISLAFDGQLTTYIPAMTGAVTSPEPYQMVTATVNMLRTQALAAAWEAQKALSTLLGDVQIIPDASTLPTFQVYNTSMQNLRELPFNGEDAGYVMTLQGYIIVNNDLFNLL